MCPACRARAGAPILWGLPSGPPRPGVSIGGCRLPGPMEDLATRECAACGHTWADAADVIDEDERDVDAAGEDL